MISATQCRRTLAIIGLTLPLSALAAIQTYDESVDGDLSAILNNPTVIGGVITDGLEIIGSEQFHDAYVSIGDSVKFTIGAGLTMTANVTGSVTIGLPITQAEMTFSLGNAPYSAVYTLDIASDATPQWYERVPVITPRGTSYDSIPVQAPLLIEGDWFLGTSGYGIQYDYALPCETKDTNRVCGLAEVDYAFSIAPAAVPLPAAAYLLGSALIGLGVFRRRRG